MLQATFIFLKGIGENTERLLWEEGIDSWDAFLTSPTLPRITLARKGFYDQELVEAKKHFQDRNTRFFAQRLKSRDHWRLYDQFRNRTRVCGYRNNGATVTLWRNHSRGNLWERKDDHAHTRRKPFKPHGSRKNYPLLMPWSPFSVQALTFLSSKERILNSFSINPILICVLRQDGWASRGAIKSH